MHRGLIAFLAFVAVGICRAHRVSTKGNEGNEEFHLRVITFVFFVVFCSLLQVPRLTSIDPSSPPDESVRLADRIGVRGRFG